MELCQNLFSAPSVFPPLFFPNPVSPCGHAAKNKFSERKNDKGEFDQPTELVEIFGGAPWSVRAKYLLFLMVASSSCPNQVASGAGKGCCGQFGIAHCTTGILSSWSMSVYVALITIKMYRHSVSIFFLFI